MTTNSLRICTAAAVTALMCVLAGGAIAGIRPDDRSGPRGSDPAAQATYPDFVDRALANLKAHALRPDDRSGMRGPGLSTERSSPDFVDRAVRQHPRPPGRSLRDPDGVVGDGQVAPVAGRRRAPQ